MQRLEDRRWKLADGNRRRMTAYGQFQMANGKLKNILGI
jgi:hypothetical protein